MTYQEVGDELECVRGDVERNGDKLDDVPHVSDVRFRSVSPQLLHLGPRLPCSQQHHQTKSCRPGTTGSGHCHKLVAYYAAVPNRRGH